MVIDKAELGRLVSLYDLERYLFEVVSKRFAQDGTLSAYDFFAILTWKSNRTKTKIKQGLAAAGQTPGQLMRDVSLAGAPDVKVKTLLRIWGIGLPIASAILAVCYPETFTVLDERAWESLQQIAVEGLPRRFPASVRGYLQYCDTCRSLAEQTGFSLRDLDRALWARSWENDLLELARS